MAQDDYYYEIQLTNKQLVFYFLAGATGLILSFLAGVMVGKGVDPAPPVEARVVGERITPEPGVKLAEEDLSFPAALEEDATASQPAAAQPTPEPTAAVPEATPTSTPPPTPVPRPEPTAAPATPPPTTAPPTTIAAAPAAAPAGGFFTIQVGAYRDEASAIELRNGLNAKGFHAYVVTPDGAEGLHVVRVGRYPRREDAERARDILRDKEKFTPFIVDQK